MADLEKLDKTIKELETQSNNLIEFNKVYSEIGKLKDDISKNLSLLKANNNGFNSISKEIESRLKESKEQIENLERDTIKKIQELYQDNKNFQKELDGFLTTHLNKHKTDIQTNIRNESTQLQSSFQTNLNSNFVLLNQKLETLLEKHSSQLNTLKILLIIVILTTLGLAVEMFFI